jgi:Uma2 family endonuclease
MASHAPQGMTLADFLAWDDGTDWRYQLIHGVPVMKAPAAESHRRLAAALMIEIGSRLKRSCRVISKAGISVEGRSDTCYVADLAVTCASGDHDPRMIVDPMLVVEVVSPSVGEIEGFRKIADYRSLPSVREIVIAFHGERRITLLRRTANSWRVEDLIGQASIMLGACESPIPLEAIYRDLLEPAAPEAPSGL